MKNFLSLFDMIPTNVLLAVSGGADSMALFHLYNQTNNEYAVAHMQYGEGDWRDQAFRLIKKYGSIYSKRVWVKKVTVTHSKRIGFEASARNLRYDFFREIISSNQYKALVTAHTMDDLAETVEIALRRKQGEHAVAAIPSVGKLTLHPNQNVPIFRPFLNCFRSHIRSYLQQNNFQWIDDPTNVDPSYSLRNKIRLEWSLLPTDEYRSLITKKCELAIAANRLVQEANQSVVSAISNHIDFNTDKNKIIVSTSWLKSLSNIELIEFFFVLFQYWNLDFGSVSGGSRVSFMKVLHNNFWGAKGSLSKVIHYRITSKHIVFTNNT